MAMTSGATVPTVGQPHPTDIEKKCVDLELFCHNAFDNRTRDVTDLIRTVSGILVSNTRHDGT